MYFCIGKNRTTIMKLDMHSEMILDEYRELQPVYTKIKNIALELLRQKLKENNMSVTAIEGRIKTEKSLAGKLELKGQKYRSIDDITDIVGVRIITFFSDEVDKIAALVEQMLEIDWDNSVDKRKMLEIDRFGYMSLHYICRIPKSLHDDPQHPLVNQVRFEIQMRTALQHVWANMQHDTGYKSEVEIPVEYQRSLNRLAGILELADEQFSRIRKEINDYRRNVQSLVTNGNFDEVPLNGDTFRSYCELLPFQRLAEKIATINQAELFEDSPLPYYEVLRRLNMKTLGDVERMRSECSDGAYQLALIQLTGTGLDIVAYSVAIQNICIVKVLRSGYGVAGLTRIFQIINGESDYNIQRANTIYQQALRCNLITNH